MLPLFVTDRNGNVYLSDLARYVKGTVITPASSQTPITIAAASSATIPRPAPPVIVEGPVDAMAEVYSLIGEHGTTDNPAVQAKLSCIILDTAYRRQLMNRDILANHIFGTNLNPFFLPESLFLEMQQTLAFNFINNSTAGSSNYRLVLEARKSQAAALSNKLVSDYIGEMRRRKRFLYPYWLTSDQAISIPASGTKTVFFTCTQDIRLLLFSIIASGVSTGVAGDITEQFTVTLKDALTQRPLQNQPVPKNCIAGTAAFPYALPAPLYVEPNTKIEAFFTNLITDATLEIFFTFQGVASYLGAVPVFSGRSETPAPSHRGAA